MPKKAGELVQSAKEGDVGGKCLFMGVCILGARRNARHGIAVE